MPDTRVFTLEGGSVAAGGNERLTETDNSAWVVEKIQVQEASGAALPASDATISVRGSTKTTEVVPIQALVGDYDALPVWELDWPQDVTVRFSWTNDEGSSRQLNVMLWVREG